MTTLREILLAVALLAALTAPFLRHVLLRHLWMSYRTGFGQSVSSVVVGVGATDAAKQVTD